MINYLGHIKHLEILIEKNNSKLSELDTNYLYHVIELENKISNIFCVKYKIRINQNGVHINEYITFRENGTVNILSNFNDKNNLHYLDMIKFAYSNDIFKDSFQFYKNMEIERNKILNINTNLIHNINKLKSMIKFDLLGLKIGYSYNFNRYYSGNVKIIHIGNKNVTFREAVGDKKIIKTLHKAYFLNVYHDLTPDKNTIRKMKLEGI